jgi:hypothetical protein
MDVYKIEITKADGTRRCIHTAASDARNAQRAFGTAAAEAGFYPDWSTLEVIGNKILVARRHKTSNKRLREFECSFQGPEGIVDSDVFEARCATHARTVARRIAKERHAQPLYGTLRSRDIPLK